MPSAADDRAKFEKVERELLMRALREKETEVRALREKEAEARRQMDFAREQQLRQYRQVPQFDPIEIEKMKKLAELALDTQQQRAAEGLRRTTVRVMHWQDEEEQLEKELLDAYAAEARD